LCKAPCGGRGTRSIAGRGTRRTARGRSRIAKCLLSRRGRPKSRPMHPWSMAPSSGDFPGCQVIVLVVVDLLSFSVPEESTTSTEPALSEAEGTTTTTIREDGSCHSWGPRSPPCPKNANPRLIRLRHTWAVFATFAPFRAAARPRTASEPQECQPLGGQLALLVAFLAGILSCDGAGRHHSRHKVLPHRWLWRGGRSERPFACPPSAPISTTSWGEARWSSWLRWEERCLRKGRGLARTRGPTRA